MTLSEKLGVGASSRQLPVLLSMEALCNPRCKEPPSPHRQVWSVNMSGNSSGSGIGPLAFIVGGLVVAAGIGFFLFNGAYLGGHTTSTTTAEKK